MSIIELIKLLTQYLEKYGDLTVHLDGRVDFFITCVNEEAFFRESTEMAKNRFLDIQSPTPVNYNNIVRLLESIYKDKDKDVIIDFLKKSR